MLTSPVESIVCKLNETAERGYVHIDDFVAGINKALDDAIWKHKPVSSAEERSGLGERVKEEARTGATSGSGCIPVLVRQATRLFPHSP